MIRYIFSVYLYILNTIENKVVFFPASNDITSPVRQDAKYVIKIEPHNNGPLFVERNFYVRVACKHMSKYINNN